jgi:hypothetical protein
VKFGFVVTRTLILPKTLRLFFRCGKMGKNERGRTSKRGARQHTLFRFSYTSSRQQKLDKKSESKQKQPSVESRTTKVPPSRTHTNPTTGHGKRIYRYKFQSAWKQAYPFVMKVPLSHNPPSKVSVRGFKCSHNTFRVISTYNISDKGGTLRYAKLAMEDGSASLSSIGVMHTLVSNLTCTQMDDRGNDTCSICTDVRSAHKYDCPQCQHSFCAGCINAWQNLHPTCPMCRTDILLHDRMQCVSCCNPALQALWRYVCFFDKDRSRTFVFVTSEPCTRKMN